MITKKLALIIFKLITYIPRRIRCKLGVFLGWLISKLPLKEAKIAELQLAKFIPTANAKEITKKVFLHFSEVIFESINLNPLLEKQQEVIEVNDLDLIKRLVRDKRPVIALTAHFGNWELLAASMVKLGVPLVTVGRMMRISLFQHLLSINRERYGINTIWRGGINGQRQLVEALKSGKTVAALIDQDTRVASLSSTFFGQHVATPSALIELGIRHNAHFVTAFCAKDNYGKYSVFVEELNDSTSAQKIADIFNESLEKIIKKYPEQWVWFHKRWRTTSSGKRLNNSEYEQFLLNKSSF